MTTWSQSHTTNIQLLSNAQELALHFSSGVKKIDILKKKKTVSIYPFEVHASKVML